MRAMDIQDKSNTQNTIDKSWWNTPKPKLLHFKYWPISLIIGLGMFIYWDYTALPIRGGGNILLILLWWVMVFAIVFGLVPPMATFMSRKHAVVSTGPDGKIFSFTRFLKLLGLCIMCVIILFVLLIVFAKIV